MKIQSPVNAETEPLVGARFIAPDAQPDTSAFNPDIHHRRSIRLRSYDYSQAGAYFITLCAQKKACLFGAIVGDVMHLNDAGRLVRDIWGAIPEHYSCIELDSFVVMPNHIHGIVVLNDVGEQFDPHPNPLPKGEGTIVLSPSGGKLDRGLAPNSDQGAIALHSHSTNPSKKRWVSGWLNRAPTIGEIIRAFKARCTHDINQLRGAQGVSIWQRNYYEHIIRNESSLQEIREYIANNPAQWAIDRENPDAVGAQFIAPNNDDAVNQGAMNRAPTGGKA